VPLPRTAATHQLPAGCKSLPLAPHPAIPGKALPRCRRAGFFIAMRKAQALAFYSLIINSLNIYLTVLLK